MKLGDIMTTAVEVIDPHVSLQTAARRMRLSDIHHLVVVSRHGSIVGLLTRDALEQRRAEGARQVEDAMLRNITMASPDMTVKEVVELMRPGHTQTAVPVLCDQRLVGIVTVSDLLRLAGTLRGHHQTSTT